MKLPSNNRHAFRTPLFVFALFASSIVGSQIAMAQVRTKKPDRGIYRPPVLTLNDDGEEEPTSRLAEMIRSQNIQHDEPETVAAEFQEQEAEELEVEEPELESQEMESPEILRQKPKLQQVGHSEFIEGEVWPAPTRSFVEGGYEQGEYYEEPGCGMPELAEYGCDTYGCDTYGCDSMGCGGGPNAELMFSRQRWFGNLELLMMWRSGNYLPPLLTTGPSTSASPGQIGIASTAVLAGGRAELDGVTAGGRLTLGTWLDNYQSRSMVFRGWAAEEEKFSFSANQLTTPIITRPFFNVTTGQAAAQDTQVIANPGFTNQGRADVHATSNVYGGDLSIRQHAYSRFGGTVDVLYGYQYMRLDEDLSISSNSTAGPNNSAPLGSLISISDSFDAENEFHGGQIGIASRYREGCWSFRSLLKVAAGSIQRKATLKGQTETVSGTSFISPNGLLVRSTNAGTRTDNTFGWVPELDVSLGWRYFRNFDVTIGYHAIAMTDAIQPAGLIDQQLAVNLANPIDDPRRPAVRTNDKTFYVHGIHFGLEFAY